MEWKSIKSSLDGKLFGNQVSALGRVKGVRKHKGILFIDLVDYTGKVQLVVEKSEHPLEYEAFSRSIKELTSWRREFINVINEEILRSIQKD